MMDTMEKRKKKLELELLRGILGAIEADIDLEHDFSELLEGAPIKGRKTVPRQTNVPPDKSNVTSWDVGTQASKEAGVGVFAVKVLNPYDYNEMEVPGIGDRVFMVCAVPEGLVVQADQFHGTEIELLMLAQRRLFIDRADAEAYMVECKAVIGGIEAQLDM